MVYRTLLLLSLVVCIPLFVKSGRKDISEIIPTAIKIYLIPMLIIQSPFHNKNGLKHSLLVFRKELLCIIQIHSCTTSLDAFKQKVLQCTVPRVCKHNYISINLKTKYEIFFHKAYFPEKNKIRIKLLLRYSSINRSEHITQNNRTKFPWTIIVH